MAGAAQAGVATDRRRWPAPDCRRRTCRRRAGQGHVCYCLVGAGPGCSGLACPRGAALGGGLSPTSPRRQACGGAGHGEALGEALGALLLRAATRAAAETSPAADTDACKPVSVCARSFESKTTARRQDTGATDGPVHRPAENRMTRMALRKTGRPGAGGPRAGGVGTGGAGEWRSCFKRASDGTHCSEPATAHTAASQRRHSLQRASDGTRCWRRLLQVLTKTGRDEGRATVCETRLAAAKYAASGRKIRG